MLCVVSDDGLGHPAVMMRACDNVDDGRKGDKMYHGVRLRLYVVKSGEAIVGHVLCMTPQEAIRRVVEDRDARGLYHLKPSELAAYPTPLMIEGMPEEY